MSTDLQDTAKEAIEFLRKVREDNPRNVTSVFFVEKRSSEKFDSYRPQISAELQDKILELVLPNTIQSLGLPVVQYNPIGAADGENELQIPSQVPCVETFLNSIEESDLFVDMNGIRVPKINFYCIKISYNGQMIYLFRQFTKMNRLRKGILGQLVSNELQEIVSDFLGIDEYVDVVLFNEALLILNHISMERIFNYKDKFIETTRTAIGAIVTQGVMIGVERFYEDCLRDIRIMKRLTNLMSQERLPLFFDNFDNVPRIVEALGLDIEFDDGKMIYRDRSQLFHIVNLMSDSLPCCTPRLFHSSVSSLRALID